MAEQINQQKARELKRVLTELTETVITFAWRMDEVCRAACAPGVEEKLPKRLGKQIAHLLNALDFRNDQARRFTLGLGIALEDKNKVFKREAKKAGADKLADDPDGLYDRVRIEQERCIGLIRQYLLFDNQRAVSWHEVNDCIKAIQEGEPMPPRHCDKDKRRLPC